MKECLINKEKNSVIEEKGKMSLEEKMDRFNDKHSWSKFSEKQIKTRVKIYRTLFITLGIMLILLSVFEIWALLLGIGAIIYALNLEKVIAKDIARNKKDMSKYEDKK